MDNILQPADLAGAEPVQCVLYAATTTRSPLDIAMQLQCCRSWIVGSRLREVAAFSDDGGRRTPLQRRQGFDALMHTVQGGVPVVVLASTRDIAGKEVSIHQAIERLISAGAVVLCAQARRGYVALDAIGSFDRLLEALKLQGSTGAVFPSVAPFAALLNAHLAEAEHREREQRRKLRAGRARPSPRIDDEAGHV